ncbi:hypothetical protein K4K56_005007 [Colletotrichum sp. SAR 10_98]|nr:hypothetical protein K4K56_005007 [Colletotrichum sp. SAR 10_98]
MEKSPTSPQAPPGDIGSNDAHGDDTPNDHVHRGGSSHTDIPDSDSSTRKATDHRITQVEKPACSTLSNMGTSDSTVDQSSRSFLLGLPGEIILEILRAFPPRPQIADFQYSTFETKRQLFSDIYLTKGKQMGLLLRSFIEEPRFCTHVRGLCLGFALNREREAYDGVHTIYEKIDLNKIPTSLLGALEHCGVKEQQTGALTDDDVEESFEIFAGLMLSLTTRLEHLTIGFDDRDRTHPVDERRADLYSPPRINRESPSGIDRFISAFHSTYGGNDAGSPDRNENFKHKILTHLQRLEIHGNVYRFFEWPPILTRFSRFPVPGLLALPTLTSFTSYSDSSQWASLSETGRAAPLALQELSLYQETKTGSALCSLLERCPDLKKLEIMHNLVNLQADVPCLFKSLEDLALADVSGRLPPNIENLTIYDMWYRDPRFLYCMRYEVRAPDDYVLHSQDNTDAVAEPFAEMLLRLRSSLLAGRLPNLRKVAVKSPIFEFDAGNASSDLTKAYEAAEVEFKVIPYEFHLPYEEGISFSERGRNKIC